MEKRPRIKVKRTSADWLVDIAGMALLLLLIGLPIVYYNDLPAQVPRHYNALGEPDAFSAKENLWTLPVVGCVLFLGLMILNRYPHVFNYPQEITRENAPRQYRIATKLVRVLNLIVVAAFTFIEYRTLRIGLGQESGLGGWFLPTFLLAVFIPMAYFIYQATRKAKD